MEPIELTVLESGPCKQNIIQEKDVQVEALPAPWIHKDDGGKYIQTYDTPYAINRNFDDLLIKIVGMHVIQSPDGKWTN